MVFDILSERHDQQLEARRSLQCPMYTYDSVCERLIVASADNYTTIMLDEFHIDSAIF